MKKLAIIFLLSVPFMVGAQQIALYSQYMFNQYVLNPAFAGTKDYLPVQANIRRQWVGIAEAPVTQTVSAHSYAGMNLGIGGAFFNEASGPTRRTGFNFTTAYHLIVNERNRQQDVLSFGLTGALTQHVLDKNRLTTYIKDDPTIIAAYNYQMVPDFNFGVLYHSQDKYYVGLSVMNLIQSKKDIYNISNILKNQLVRNYYIMAGVNYKANQVLDIAPSVVFRMIEATPIQFDANVRFSYLRKYWLGASYRHKDAIAAMLGMRIQKFAFGYSYDFTTSDIRNYSAGTHELSLTLILNEGTNFYGGKPGNVRAKRGKYRPTYY